MLHILLYNGSAETKEKDADSRDCPLEQIYERRQASRGQLGLTEVGGAVPLLSEWTSHHWISGSASLYCKALLT